MVTRLSRLPVVPSLRDAELEQVREAHEADDATKRWLKENIRHGLVVVVYRSGALSDEYVLDEVVDWTNRIVYTRVAHDYNGSIRGHTRGAWYYTGQSVHTPTGKTKLLLPNPIVVAAAMRQQKVGPLDRRVHETLKHRGIEQTSTLFEKNHRE